MRAQNHRMGSGQALDQFTNFDNLLGVETHCGFVEDQNLGIVQECLGESDPLAVAAGKISDQAMPDLAESQPLDFPIHGGGEFFSTKPSKSSHKCEIFRHRELLVHRWCFWEVPNPSFHFEGLIGTIEPGHSGGSFRGRYKAGQDAHGRRLPGTVGAEKRKHFAFRDAKGDTVDGRVLSVAFGDLLNFDHAWVVNESIVGPLAVGWHLFHVPPDGILLSHPESVNTERTKLYRTGLSCYSPARGDVLTVRDDMGGRWQWCWRTILAAVCFGLLVHQSAPVYGAEGRVYRVHGKVVAINLQEIPNVIVVKTPVTSKDEMTVGAVVNHQTKIMRGTKHVALHTIQVGEVVSLTYVKRQDGLFARTIHAR